MNANAFGAMIVLLFALADVVVLMRIYALMRPARQRRYWRGFLVGWLLAAIGFCVMTLFNKALLGGRADPFPRWLVAAQYLWHFLFLPVLVAGMVVEMGVRLVWRGWKWIKCRMSFGFAQGRPNAKCRMEEEAIRETQPAVTSVSRRQFLASAALVTAPIVTCGLSGVSLAQLGKFRIRTFDLPVVGLPAALAGYSITVIADVHVGVFTTQKMLDDIADASNGLRSELVLLPGDLINITHGDLPSALDMVVRLEARDGVYLIQGNHDVVEGPPGFDEAVRRRGVNLLTDELAIIRPRGVPMQLLGTRWVSDPLRDESVAYTAGLRDPEIFSIMMAHHPHSWDVAAACGVPLMLAGHTHGGQIMLTKTIGLGPLRFRYISGQYDKPGSTLIVSNGVGNWFPLRFGAPAEILRINLYPRETSNASANS